MHGRPAERKRRAACRCLRKFATVTVCRGWDLGPSTMRIITMLAARTFITPKVFRAGLGMACSRVGEKGCERGLFCQKATRC